MVRLPKRYQRNSNLVGLSAIAQCHHHILSNQMGAVRCPCQVHPMEMQRHEKIETNIRQSQARRVAERADLSAK